MPKSRGGLGRGIGALIPGAQAPVATEDSSPAADAPPQGQQGVLEVLIDRISPNPHQPRHEFEEEMLQELAESIREHGILQPLIVTRAEEGPGVDSYYLIAGERRWRASRLAGLRTVPVIVKEAAPDAMLALALVENVQRADLHPLEEARAYRELMDTFGMTQEEVARRVGRKRTTVANIVRLLNLPHEIIEALRRGDVTQGHARAILQLEGREAQLRMLEEVIDQGYSVRQTEETVRRVQEGEGAAPETETPLPAPRPVRQRALPDIETSALERQFQDALKTKVDLTRSSKGGKLVIHFYSEEMLEQLYQVIVQHEAGRQG